MNTEGQYYAVYMHLVQNQDKLTDVGYNTIVQSYVTGGVRSFSHTGRKCS